MRRIAVVFLSGVVAAQAHAGRPLSSDDAAVEPAGVCHLETWYQRADDARAWVFSPACGLAGDVELAAQWARFSPGLDDRHAIGLQVKAAFAPLTLAGWRFGAKLNYDAARTAPPSAWRSDTWAVTGLATREVADGIALHVNLGGQRRVAARRDAMLYGLALEWTIAPRWLAFAETFGDDRSGATRVVGGRWWAIEDRIGLDFTLGHQAGAAGSRFLTLGVSFYGFGE